MQLNLSDLLAGKSRENDTVMSLVTPEKESQLSSYNTNFQDMLNNHINKLSEPVEQSQPEYEKQQIQHNESDNRSEKNERDSSIHRETAATKHQIDDKANRKEAKSNNEVAANKSINGKEEDQRDKTVEENDKGLISLIQQHIPGNNTHKITDKPVAIHDLDKLDIKDLDDILRKISNVIEKGIMSRNSSADFQQKSADFESSLKEFMQKKDMAGLKNLLKDVKSLVELTDKAFVNGSNKADLTDSLLKMKSLIKNIIQSMSKETKSQNETSINSGNLVKDITAKIETLTAILGEKSSQGNNSSEGNDSSNSAFNFNTFKGSSSGRSATSSLLNQQTSTLFKEQLNSILEQARITVRDGRNGTLSLKLNPKELGNLNVSLGLEQGVLTGRFLVESEDAKQLLLSNLDSIREQMEEAGISLGEFHVNVRDEQKQFFDEESQKEYLEYTAETDANHIMGEYDSSALLLHDGGSLNVVI